MLYLMCGITGFIGRGREQDLERMTGIITHRGPDDQGMLFRNGVGLGNTRLAIVDLSSAGHQPMGDPQGEIALVFNGEIYNFREIRKELAHTGKYHFRSETDTEVILYAYREWGEQCFEKLNGMFAIALYDFAEEKLILARDRMGKKPLYYGVSGGTMVFGSELKAMLAHPEVKHEVDPAALVKYFLYGYVPTPHAIFRGVRKLEPGTYLAWKRGEAERHVRFWSPDFLPEDRRPLSTCLPDLEKLIDDSVKRRLIADVPLGVFLSGGIDSSTIAYFAARHSAARRMQTFSIGFEDKTFDESPYAREVANYLGCDHTEYQVRGRDMLEMIPLLPEIADEPLADSSIIPTAVLCRLARKHVTVALSGDGGDELFAGYPTFLADRIAAAYDFLPSWIRRGIVPYVVASLPIKDTYFNLGFKARKFLDGFRDDPRYRHHLWLGAFAPHEADMLLASNMRAAVHRAQSGGHGFDDLDRCREEMRAGSRGNRMLALYQRTYLMDQVLVKVDRASMAYALEVRSPFLDYRLVEFVNHLPYHYKQRRFTLKYILKKLMEDKLPISIVHRKKKGFAAPVSRWLKNELLPMAREHFLSERMASDGFLNPQQVKNLWEDHTASRADNGRKLWAILQFQLWRNRWLS